MADHFVGYSRGIEGTKYSDFTTGAASTGALQMELRITDAAGGVGVRRKDVVLFLEALERFFENAQQTTTAGFLFVIDG